MQWCMPIIFSQETESGEFIKWSWSACARIKQQEYLKTAVESDRKVFPPTEDTY